MFMIVLRFQELLNDVEYNFDANEQRDPLLFSLEDNDSICSDSIKVLQDDGARDDELLVTLGRLTRINAQNQMWESKFAAFNTVIGYVTSYAAYARFCHFLDIYGIIFIPVFFVCMFLVGLPLVYLEMALGQFTTMNVVVIFERMAPIASGLGVSMLLLSLLVTVMDYSLLFTLFTVLGNSLQININEMPWHRCSNEGDSQTCDSMVKCHQQYERIFHESISQVGVAEHDYIYSDDTEGTHIERFRLRDIGGQCVRTDFVFNTNEAVNILPYVVFNNHRPTQNFLVNNIGINNGIIPFFRFPSGNDMLVFFSTWLILFAISMEIFVYFSRVCIMSTIMFNSIMITVLVVILLSKLDAFVTVTSYSSQGLEVWASAILLTLSTLRIGQGGLFFLGSQNKFKNNLFVDALAIVIYIFAAISLYSTAHVLFRAIGGLYLFDGSVENYAAHLQEKRNERLYSQFFSYWTTAGDLIVYGPFEPFLQLVLSFGCALIVLISNVVTIESIVANCVAALDSSDDASKLTIRTILTFFLALCSFFLNSKVGLNTAITIENTVIPIATACVVLIELFVVGVIYGFSRLCANCLSMNSQKEGDRLLLRIWTLSYLYFWSLSPFLILASMIVAFPYPPPSMGIIATCIVIFIILPTPVIAVLVVVREKHNMGNLRFLLVPNHNLWGPRMADDRIKATRMEKEVFSAAYSTTLVGTYTSKWKMLCS